MASNTAKNVTKHSSNSDRRNTGVVKVLKAEDLVSCKTLSERMEMMVENRCEVFIHNVDFLCKRHKLSQAKLCSEKLKNNISPPQLTGYKRRGRDIPLSVMALVASAFNLTIEEMCGQLLDHANDTADEEWNKAGRSIEEYLKYVGTYDIAYFDTSAPIGQNIGPTADTMSRAVLTIYVIYNAIGTPSFHVTAIFNCTAEERQKIANYMQNVNFSNNASVVREYYETVVSNIPKDDTTISRMKCLYDGTIHLTDRMIEITLHQVRGNDIVHLLAHNRAANSSDGKPYRGGLATMMSSSRGQEHMPCIQSALFMRGKTIKVARAATSETTTIQKCGLDIIQPELLASKLYLAPPVIGLGQEIEKIVAYMQLLFSQDDKNAPISDLSDSDKKFCLETFVEKQLTESLRRNILSYYKLSLQMDSDIYTLIQQTQ